MKISGFDILDKLSEDRMTIIWKAHQNSLNRTVAIKMLRAELASEPAEVKNFFEEGKSVAKLKHSSIMQVYDVVEEGGAYFYVMENVEGSSLAHLLDKGEKITPKRALKILKQIAEALEYAWKTSHVIHRNIKPENIYLEENDSVRLAFFGLSKVVDPLTGGGEEPSKTIVGTPYYMSPEQAQGSSLMDCRTDMYSMGALLYQLLTGNMPFHEFDPMVAADKQISGQIPHPKDINPSLSPGLCAFLSRLMMKDRKDRPKNWKEVIDDMSKLISGQLLLKRPDADAKSTIEPEAKPIAAPSSSKPGATSGAPRRSIIYIPVWIQLPAWACLLTWWYFLTRFMLDYWAQ